MKSVGGLHDHEKTLETGEEKRFCFRFERGGTKKNGTGPFLIEPCCPVQGPARLRKVRTWVGRLVFLKEKGRPLGHRKEGRVAVTPLLGDK